MPTYPNRVRRLFQARDAGYFTLPAGLDDLLAASDHLRGLPLPSVDVAGARQRLYDAVREAALAGGDLPGIEELAAANAARPVIGELAHAQASVLVQLGDELVAEVIAQADRIVVEHLRPVQLEVLAEVATVIEATGGVRAPERLLGAPEHVRTSAMGFGALVGRYGAVRMARGLLVELHGGPAKDVRGRFGEFRNLRDLWPTMGTWQAGSPPWPADPAKRLAWIVSSPAEPWCPTRAEQDALFVERYPTAEEMVAAAGGVA